VLHAHQVPKISRSEIAVGGIDRRANYGFLRIAHSFVNVVDDRTFNGDDVKPIDPALDTTTRANVDEVLRLEMIDDVLCRSGCGHFAPSAMKEQRLIGSRPDVYPPFNAKTKKFLEDAISARVRPRVVVPDPDAPVINVLIKR